MVPQNAGHVHRPAIDVDRLADGQVQQTGGLGTGQHGIAVGPVAGQAPPGFEDVDAVHVDAGQQHVAAVGGNHTQQGRSGGGDIGGVFNGGQAMQVRLADRLHANGYAAQIEPAIAELKIFGFGQNQNVGAVAFHLVIDFGRHGAHETDHRHHGGHTHHQAGHDKPGFGLAPHQVFYGNIGQSHDLGLFGEVKIGLALFQILLQDHHLVALDGPVPAAPDCSPPGPR